MATQIERGMPTRDLSPIRNHLDRMKGGRISRYIHPAKMIHILAIDPGEYDQRMHGNYWLHTLPDCTTFQEAIENLKRYNAWEAVPAAVRRHLEEADPEQETLKAKDFAKMSFRIFGLMPGYWQSGKLLPAMKKAEELGFKAIIVADQLIEIEACQAGIYMASVANTIERRGLPCEPPCALFSSGELVVTVGQEKGIGGRDQEFALSAALRIAGSKNIIIASVDTDGTDGPGSQFIAGAVDIPCLAGGIVDGQTVESAKNLGVDIVGELRRHNTSPALWKLNSGIVVTPNISLIDLTVALIMGRWP
jgi:glycerate-2-kinase